MRRPRTPASRFVEAPSSLLSIASHADDGDAERTVDGGDELADGYLPLAITITRACGGHALVRPLEDPRLRITIQIVEKLRCGAAARDQQVIAGARAGDVEEMPLGVVDVGEISVVRDGLDSFLERKHYIVAGHDDDRAELEALCQMHGADRDFAADRFDVVIENSVSEPGTLDR